MNSPCAEPKLRCRVKDLVASCFNTRRLPLEEEEAADSKRPPKTSLKASTSSHKSGGGSWRAAAEAEPRFAEEDYIVFCFGEDGEIHMINNDRKSSEILQPCCSVSTTKMMKNEVEQPNISGSKMESSFESCDSSLSETSTCSSFAFPVLGMEWIGSPLHMPNAEKRNACRRCATL
ncbi:uncharacterized protein LOC131008775 [Salvia miltiorrhiza]|uniref:uncharacterized protein LOC131008775 n=1 Tax=Salvia miltiorrhiza TaxID=226208 RepID=UPI0025AB5FDD|nr:uncharacterized protein LOC131008775 [Salvia miltiorrhiza]